MGKGRRGEGEKEILLAILFKVLKVVRRFLYTRIGVRGFFSSVEKQAG